MKQYPKWLYSRDASKIVQSVEEHEACGAGWYESPADIPAAVPEPAADEPTSLVEPVVARRRK